MSKIIGIDLGTTNSCLAYLREGGEVEVIVNSQGNRTTPSVVSFTDQEELLVGEVAKNQAVLNADKTIRSIKRHMGTDHKEIIGSKEYTPQQISAMILQKLKYDAEEYIGEMGKSSSTTMAVFDVCHGCVIVYSRQCYPILSRFGFSHWSFDVRATDTGTTSTVRSQITTTTAFDSSIQYMHTV